MSESFSSPRLFGVLEFEIHLIHFARRCPHDWVSLSFERNGLAPSFRRSREQKSRAASRAYEKGWGHKPVFTRGGSVPIVADLYDIMRIPVVMMGYGLDSDGLHAPHEHYSIEMFHRGVERAIVYLDELASQTESSKTSQRDKDPHVKRQAQRA